MPRFRIETAGLIVLAAALSACASAPPAGIAGQRTAAAGPGEVRPASLYSERGLASWYGERYHGRTTASGARFDMNAMTAAHRTLPFGTRVNVTNLENGRAAVVTINDRGPFIAGRIIDVSRRAAEHLGFRHQGLARVGVEALAGS